MRVISPKVRKQLADDPRMRFCAIRRLAVPFGACDGRIEWHHVWDYASRQIDEVWAIVGACHFHHEKVNKDSRIKSAFQRVSLALATDEDLAKYAKKNWSQIKLYLASVAPVDKQSRRRVDSV